MAKKKETKKIKTSELFADFPNLYETASEDDMSATFAFAEEYKAFLDDSKTEREFAANAIAAAEELGYVDIATKDTLKAGDKVYQSIKGKGFAAAIIGKKGPAEGFNILGAHIDSPRLDLKPNPIYEDNDTVYFKTHYYGGIKKYQWTTIPLAVHGVVFTNDGKAHQIVVGEKDTDPVFYITDLLPHLGNDQMAKKASEFIPAEDLNVVIGGIPCTDDKKSHEIFKAGVLKILFEEYGIKEKDFVSAEIEIVPATHARDVGFDRAYIAAYGHDDKVCAYPALRALLAQEHGGQQVGGLRGFFPAAGSDRQGLCCQILGPVFQAVHDKVSVLVKDLRFDPGGPNGLIQFPVPEQSGEHHALGHFFGIFKNLLYQIGNAGSIRHLVQPGPDRLPEKIPDRSIEGAEALPPAVRGRSGGRLRRFLRHDYIRGLCPLSIFGCSLLRLCTLLCRSDCAMIGNAKYLKQERNHV